MPHINLKPLDQQVAVILGGSSGIGRETALRLADAGAKVVVAARSEPGLASLMHEIADRGGDAVSLPCDVADRRQVEAVAELAMETFGRIDTWVNVAAVSIYATVEETTPAEFRRVMDINFMGQLHGVQTALPHLRREGRGALISISSVESMVSLPLHGAYAASKHAVEGMIDALRRELMAEGVPISITSIKPASVNTPFFNASRNRMEVKPKGPPPFYEPGVVADCVLYAAAHPVRDLYAGGAARMMTMSEALTPRLVDAALARLGIPAQRTDEPETDPAGNLDVASADDRAEGDFGSQAMGFSPYVWLETHPTARNLLAAGALTVAGMALRRRWE